MTFVAAKRPVRRAAMAAAPDQRSIAELLYQGQGTVRVALAAEGQPLTVTWRTDMLGSRGVRWRIEDTVAVCEEGTPDSEWREVARATMKRPLSAAAGANYWFSLDSHNRAVRLGMGEMRLGTQIGSFVFAAPEKEEETPYGWLGLLTFAEIEGPVKPPLAVFPDPVVVEPPPRVLPHDMVTMEDLARGEVTVPGSLSPVCQRLYDNVAGARFELDSPDFPDFSQAIKASILDPNGWCCRKLKEKADFFKSSDPTMGYLRITLGEDAGESPGIPFVLEVWPSGHKSPVHDHANANAVIRVFHGAVQVRMFAMLSDPLPDPFATKTFSEGDVTWITSQLNQVHQLENFGEEPCITIQCYMYEEQDRVHQPGFSDLVDGKAMSFLPYSDADFIWFKKKMREEWYGLPSAPAPKPHPEPAAKPEAKPESRPERGLRLDPRLTTIPRPRIR